MENEADLLETNTEYKYVSDYTDVPHEVYVQEKPNSMSHFNNKLFTLLHADSELTQYGNKPLTGLDLVNGAKIAFETRPMTDEDIEQNFVIYKVNLQGILYDIYPGATLTIRSIDSNGQETAAGSWDLVDGRTVGNLTLALGDINSWRVKVNWAELTAAEKKLPTERL